VNRRHAHHRATPSRTGGDDRPQGACVGRPEPFDDLIDYSSGPRYFFAVREARAMCRECPIAASCLTENRDEPWAKAVMDGRAAPRHTDKCGTTAGYREHYTRREHACPSCKAATTRARAEREARRAS